MSRHIIVISCQHVTNLSREPSKFFYYGGGVATSRFSTLWPSIMARRIKSGIAVFFVLLLLHLPCAKSLNRLRESLFSLPCERTRCLAISMAQRRNTPIRNSHGQRHPHQSPWHSSTHARRLAPHARHARRPSSQPHCIPRPTQPAATSKKRPSSSHPQIHGFSAPATISQRRPHTRFVSMAPSGAVSLDCRSHLGGAMSLVRAVSKRLIFEGRAGYNRQFWALVRFERFGEVQNCSIFEGRASTESSRPSCRGTSRRVTSHLSHRVPSRLVAS